MIALVLLAVLGAAIPRPDARMTPGATNPALTKRLICSPTFRTGPYRNVSAGKKLAVCKAYEAYGIFKCPGSGYEMDHDIPLELGGSNAIENLWPQPADHRGVIGYHTKDVVENRAHAAVCSGRLTLEDAQKGIASDWYTFGIANGFLSATGSIDNGDWSYGGVKVNLR